MTRNHLFVQSLHNTNRQIVRDVQTKSADQTADADEEVFLTITKATGKSDPSGLTGIFRFYEVKLDSGPSIAVAAHWEGTSYNFV